ncbi:L,D-transpeptidase family protein [Frateuria defendens]|uniref:L,D-transpeptidase family protein n=1 Tax=Frateuria defendens TaxID=2219559 RepID=UPI00069CD990|nr:L,D-transpeptidase family protein [Frateuria defendens]
MSVRRHFRLLGAFALCLLLPWLARAQTLDPQADAIRERVEQIDASGGSIAKLGQGLRDFYEQRQFAPVWTRPATLDQLFDELDAIRLDGLDPEDYGLSQLRLQRAALDSGRVTPAQRAEFDVLASDAYLAALVHLYRGKVDPATLDPHWNFDPRQLDPAEGLRLAREAVDSGDLHGLFARARPQEPQYAALRQALAGLRAVAANGGWPQLPEGPTLKPGMHDARVPLLRQRLVAGGYLAVDQAQGEDYDAVVQAAVRRFQQEQYIDADGNVGAATRAALNVTVAQRIGQLRVNLERARWLLHEIRGDFVVVDIAGYKVAYYKEGKPVWTSRVQVGKPYRSTPVFKSQITYLTLNPTWTVPPTILRKDILPKVRRDRGYLAANRIRVLDSQGRVLAPASVNWNNPRGVVLRQDAGPGNSLGRVVIRFPNEYAVYLHDTPHTELFDRDQRTTSSGCIRVERPRELAELLLDDPAKWNRAAIDAAIDTLKTQTVTLRTPVTLLLAYWTVDLREDNRVSFRQDIYDRDGRTLAALDKRRASPLGPAIRVAAP